MDFKQLEAFLSVAKFRSFSKAANAIYLSQPTISSHISSLERELNVQLFDRTSKEVNLTPSGEAFLQYANDILNTRNHAIAELCNFNNTVTGKLDIFASTTPCNTILPELITSFNKIHSNIKFNVMEKSSSDIISDVISLQCELGIVNTKINNPKIKVCKLVDDELIVLSSPKLRLPPSIDITDLLTYNFIIREKDSHTTIMVENYLESMNIDFNKLKVLCEVNNIHTQLKLVELGLGIAVASKVFFENSPYVNTLNTTTIKDANLTRDISLVLSYKRTLSPIATAFFNMCKEKYKFKE